MGSHEQISKLAWDGGRTSRPKNTLMVFGILVKKSGFVNILTKFVYSLLIKALAGVSLSANFYEHDTQQWREGSALLRQSTRSHFS